MIITSPSLILTFDGGGASFHSVTFKVTKGMDFIFCVRSNYKEFQSQIENFVQPIVKTIGSIFLKCVLFCELRLVVQCNCT